MVLKKEIVYTVDYETKEQIKEAKELRDTLFQEGHETVDIYPNGLSEALVVVLCEIK